MWMRVASNLATLTKVQKRLVLEALGVQVRVWRPDHRPLWQLDMSVPMEPSAPEFIVTASCAKAPLAAHCPDSSIAGHKREPILTLRFNGPEKLDG